MVPAGVLADISSHPHDAGFEENRIVLIDDHGVKKSKVNVFAGCSLKAILRENDESVKSSVVVGPLRCLFL